MGITNNNKNKNNNNNNYKSWRFLRLLSRIALECLLISSLYHGYLQWIKFSPTALNAAIRRGSGDTSFSTPVDSPYKNDIPPDIGKSHHSTPSSELLHSTTRNYVPNKDPALNTTNCHDLLESYRRGEIPSMKQGTEEYPIDKSYVRRTVNSKPFYVSVHDEKIDGVRADLFLRGRYYESQLSKIIQNVFQRKNWSTASFSRTNSSSTTTAAATDTNHGKTAKKPSIMLDVGGNIGWFSLLAAAYGAEVYTFEPNVINMVRFCESQVLNGWTFPQQDERFNHIHSYMKGVSDRHGAMQSMFQISESNPGSFTFSNQSAIMYNAMTRKVNNGTLLPLVSLDALALDQGWLSAFQENEDKDEDADDTLHKKPSIGFLKIDVEGLELSVVKGAKKLLNAKIIENIAMELKVTMGTSALEEIIQILFDAGYEVYETGGWQGPADTILSGKVLSEYRSPKDFIHDLFQQFGDKDANVWFRLVDKTDDH